MKAQLVLGVKIVVLTIAVFIGLSVASAVTGLEEGTSTTPEQASSTFQAFVAVCLMYALVLAYPIVQSRWAGLKLIATMALVYYGANTFMSQIESAVFLPHVLPQGMLPRLFLNGAVAAMLIAPLAVIIMGKLRLSEPQSESSRLVMPLSEWVWKLAASTALYIVLYFSFGFFVAWQNPAIREFYEGGLVIPAWMPLFQIPRGLMWTVLALPVIRMVKGRWWEAGVAVGLLFAVLMNATLLIPYNPIMPDSVRLTHFVETATSNLIFGFLSTALMVWKPAVRREYSLSTNNTN